MKLQWTLVMGLIFAVLIAVFAVVNVDAVPVNYIFGTAQWPLVLVILGAALLGALVSGFVAIFKSYQSSRRIKELQKEMAEKDKIIERLRLEMSVLHETKEESTPYSPINGPALVSKKDQLL